MLEPQVLVDRSEFTADLAETEFSLPAFWDEMEANDIGQGNAGASLHGVEDNPDLVEARGRRVHIKGHWLEFGSRIFA